MHHVANTWLIRLGRWPTRLRRVAALACLLLAAATALHPAAHSSAAASSRSRPAASANPLSRQLAAGQVAVPVSLAGPRADGFLRPGDRIDLYASADDDTVGSPACADSGVVARAVRVLAVPDARTGLGASTDAGPVIVALGSAGAARLAELHACAMFAVLRP